MQQQRNILPNEGMAVDQARKLIAGSRVYYRRMGRAGTVVRSMDAAVRGLSLPAGHDTSLLVELDPCDGHPPERGWFWPYELDALEQQEEKKACASL